MIIFTISFLNKANGKGVVPRGLPPKTPMSVSSARVAITHKIVAEKSNKQ
jgi:hypothetical protein